MDVLSEIRIRFDRPMDPNKMGLMADITDTSNVFRLRAPPKYVVETNEFVIPVNFREGVRYRFSLQENHSGIDFCSRDGVVTRPYSWQFSTREPAAVPKGSPPRVLSIDPPTRSQTGMIATIRVRFDRPMDPQACELKGSSSPTKKQSVDLPKVEVSAPLPIEYDAAGRTLHVICVFAGQ